MLQKRLLSKTLNKVTISLLSGVILTPYFACPAAVAMDDKEGQKFISRQNASAGGDGKTEFPEGNNSWESYGYASKDAFAHISSLIKETEKDPNFYTILILTQFKNSRPDSVMRRNGILVEDYKDSAEYKHFYLQYPLAENQDQFITPILLSSISRLYIDPRKLDSRDIRKIKNICLGKLAHERQLTEIEQRYINSLVSTNQEQEKKNEIRMPLKVILNTDSPQEEMKTLVEQLVKKIRRSVSKSIDKKKPTLPAGTEHIVQLTPAIREEYQKALKAGGNNPYFKYSNTCITLSSALAADEIRRGIEDEYNKSMEEYISKKNEIFKSNNIKTQ